MRWLQFVVIHHLQTQQGRSEPLQDDPQTHAQDRIGLLDAIDQLVSGDHQKLARSKRGHRGGARLVVDDRHLAEYFTRPPPCERHVLAVSLDGNLDLAALEQKGAMATLAFAKDDAALVHQNMAFTGWTPFGFRCSASAEKILMSAIGWLHRFHAWLQSPFAIRLQESP